MAKLISEVISFLDYSIAINRFFNHHSQIEILPLEHFSMVESNRDHFAHTIIKKLSNISGRCRHDN